MSTIGSLNVNLGMNTAGFTKGTKSAAKATRGFATSLKSLAAPFGGFIAGFSARGLVNSIADMASETIDAADDTGDLAKRLGITTESLSRLQYAAKLSGAEADALGTSMEKLSINIAKGDKSFADIGLSVEQLQKMSPDKQFLAVADAISKLSTSGERGAAAMATMGRGGTALGAMLSTSTAEIRALMEESDRLGNTLSTSQAEALGAAKDNMDRLHASVEGLKREFVTGLAPALEDITEKFGVLSKSDAAGGLGEDVGGLMKLGTDAAALTGFLFKKGQVASARLGRLADIDQGAIGGTTKEAGMGAIIAKDMLELEERTQKQAADLWNSVFNPHLVEKAATPAAQAVSKTFEQMVEDARAAKAIQDKAIALEVAAEKAKEAKAADEALAKAAKDAAREQRRMNDEIIRQVEQDMEDIQNRMMALADAAKTPMQKMVEQAAEVGAAMRAGWLNADQGELLNLQGQLDLLQSSPAEEAAGPQRVAALERGSAAAFSASFGGDPRSKREVEMLKLQRQIDATMKRIDEKLSVGSI